MSWDWKSIANIIGSALAAALAAFTATKSTGGTDETGAAAAGTAFLTAVIQHFRGTPSVTK